MDEVEVEASESHDEVEGPTPDPEADVEVHPPRLSGHEEARRRHEWDVARLRDFREERDHLNDLIRDAVRDEDLSRQALYIYEKAVEGS